MGIIPSSASADKAPYRVPTYPVYPGSDDPVRFAAWKEDLAAWVAELGELARDGGWRQWHAELRGFARRPVAAPVRTAHKDARVRRRRRRVRQIATVVRSVLAAELPAALDYLLARREGSRHAQR